MDTDKVGLFEGQTALHLAIINNDMEMMKFLIGQGADVRARAIGRFFAFGGNAYYGEWPAGLLYIHAVYPEHETVSPDLTVPYSRTIGEYPMSFCAALGLKEAALLLRRHGAMPQDKDTQGNTALHLAVMHMKYE